METMINNLKKCKIIQDDLETFRSDIAKKEAEKLNIPYDKEINIDELKIKLPGKLDNYFT